MLSLVIPCPQCWPVQLVVHKQCPGLTHVPPLAHDGVHTAKYIVGLHESKVSVTVPGMVELT